MKRPCEPVSDTVVLRTVSSIYLQKCCANMHEPHRAIILSLFVLYLNTVSGCEPLGRFNMPSLFKQGDIMIGGIFPVFNKDISSTWTFEGEPPGVKCAR